MEPQCSTSRLPTPNVDAVLHDRPAKWRVGIKARAARASICRSIFLMAILIDSHTRVLVQGITGREGASRTRLMLDYGTRVIGGVTPGRRGPSVHGLPVFDTLAGAQAPAGPAERKPVLVPCPHS